MSHAPWQRYIALGDPLADGSDGVAPGRTSAPGWAAHLAAILDRDARLGDPERCGVAFSDRTDRDHALTEVVREQVPRALAARADLVSIVTGGRELLATGADPDAVAARLEAGVSALRAAGTDVLLATSFDPRSAPSLRVRRGRAAVFNAHLWSIARRHGTFVLDVWGMRDLQSPRHWVQGRVRLDAVGHRLLANRAAHCLGVAYAEAGRPRASPEA
ncbi:SGNH/GDSL hydrolase family protein [Arenivirga flava]|uniref:SGNH hydrolase-type esterase domain-containing protein n=1 Tax=Arenivirga flava TaxID=1930060 RepID=A0AA37UPB0_9MICO|nr:SGNH/GDSL hydrolase family protein [Arenivirga flava]GMA29697.1 hypothetical protein GCM10025874_29500 [Arenivirga flava]